jgi:hypothetical protein
MNESPATASLRSATPKENTPYSFDFRGGGFFLKKERVFSFGVLPSKYSGSGGASMRTRQSKTIFAGGKGFALPRLFFVRGFDVRRAGGCGRNARRILVSGLVLGEELCYGSAGEKSVWIFQNSSFTT